MLLRFTRSRKGQALSGLVLALGLASSTGELHAQDRCFICNEYPPPASPLGQQVNRVIALQTASAATTKFVFFPNEWYMGGCELGPMGFQHMRALAKTPPEVCHPIVVETSGDPSLDEARRACLVKGLELNGLHDAEARVVINFPTRPVLRGEQAELTYLSWLASARNNWNRGLFPGMGVPGYGGLFGASNWGQGFWGMGVGGGFGYGGMLGMPYRY